MIFPLREKRKNKAGFSKMDMKQISSLLVAVALLCGGCGQESEEVRRFKATKIKAEQGDAEAQSDLGWMYCDGEGVPQDYVEAAKWYRKAAEQGNAWAQGYLGWMYFFGYGVPRDKIEAAKWIRKAAEKGVPQDDVLNINDVLMEVWYEKAAEQGDAEAQWELGLMYYHGQDTLYTPYYLHGKGPWQRRAAGLQESGKVVSKGGRARGYVGATLPWHVVLPWPRRAEELHRSGQVVSKSGRARAYLDATLPWLDICRRRRRCAEE